MPELLLHGLQLKLSESNVDFKAIHKAIFALFNAIDEASLESRRESHGYNWSVKHGKINLETDEFVTIQRQDRLIASFRQDGAHLIMSAYEPLDSRALSLIKGICQDIDTMTKEVIAEKKLQYAAHLSTGVGQHYADQEGKSYLSYWQHGLGVSNDGSIAPNWRNQSHLSVVPHMLIDMQLSVHETFNQPRFSYDQYMLGLQTSNSNRHAPIDTTDEEVRLKFLGCLLGGAIGDAFGAPVEFMSRERIISKHGENGVTALLPAYGKVGAITDDTQMTLFTAEGFLRAYVRGCHRGVTSWVGCIGHSYQRWLQTQSFDSPSNLDVTNDGLLWEIKELHSQRAPGNTCLAALQHTGSFEEFAVNDSKGCGGVMRVAPIGLGCWRLKESFSAEDCFDLGCDAARLTHGHPTGYLSAGAFAAIIYQILDGQTVFEATQFVLHILKSKHDSEETIRAIEQALRLSRTELDEAKAIATIGEGWIAEEALAISLYCVLVAEDFNQLMTISVSHDGDSDSTGAIAGNLWGVIYGLNSINEHLVKQIEINEIIAELAADIYDFPEWDIGLYSKNPEFDQLIFRKYPGG